MAPLRLGRALARTIELSIGIALIGYAISACVDRVAVHGLGHEQTMRPQVVTPARGDDMAANTLPARRPDKPAGKPASREVASLLTGPANSCHTVAESAAQVRRADETAAQYRDLTGKQATDFLRVYLPEVTHGDEVVLLVGDLFAQHTVAVVSSGGCVVTVRATDYRIPE